MAGKTIDPDLKKKIIWYLKNHSQYSTAKKFNVSSSTVNKIFQENPRKKPSPNHSTTKKAVEAHKAYAKEDRLRVLNKFMGLVDSAMDNPDLTTGDLKNISTALGTALDKYRLEETEEQTNKSGIDEMMIMVEKEAAAYSARTAPT